MNKILPKEEQIRKGGMLPQWILVIGSIFLLILSQFIRGDVLKEYQILPLVMLPIGIVLFYLGIWSVEKNHLPAWVENILNAISSRLRITPGQVFCLFFSLCFSLLTPAAAGFMAKMFSPQAAVLCWMFGILLAAYGGVDFLVKKQKVSWAAILTGISLFAAALALRAYDTTHIPIVLSGDEASSGLYSLNFLNGTVNNLFITGWFSFPTLHNFLQAISIAVFGQSTQALRLLSALAGALTVLVVFFIGRSMYGTRGGLMAAIFLAGMHYHNHFSRIGLNNIWDGLLFAITLGFLWIGWQKNNRAAYLVAGIGFGLSQYFYSTGHLLFLILPLWILIAALSDHSRFRQSIANIFLMLWMAFIILLPLAWFYLNYPNEFMAPMNRVGIFGDWLKNTSAIEGKPAFLIVLRQLWSGALAYMGTPLQAWYMPGVPILRTIPGVLFLMGLVFMAVKPKDSRSQLLFIWMAVFALSGGLSESTPAAQRYVASAPAVALMIAFSLKSIGDLFTKLLPNSKKWIEIILIFAALALSLDDARFYYKVYTPTSDFSGFNGMVAQTLANRLKNEPAGEELVFCGYPNMGYDSIASLPYLAPHIKYYNVATTWGAEGTPVPEGNKIFFVFLPTHESDQAAMEEEYPGGTWQEYLTDKGSTLFWLYEFNRPQ